MKLIVLIASLIFIITSIPTYYRVSNGFSLSKMNIYSYFFYSTTVLTIVGSLILGINIESHYLGYAIINENTALIGMFLLTLSFWFFAFIIKNMQQIEYFKTQSYRIKIKELFYVPSKQPTQNFTFVFVLLMMFSFAAVVYTFYIIGFSNIPLVNFFMGADTEYLAFLRQQVGRNFQGNVYVRNIIALGLTPLLSYISFVHYSLKKEKKWLIFTIVTVFLSVIILTYDLQKAPVLRYLFAYIFILPHTYKGRFNIKPKYIVLFGILVMVMFLAFTSIDLIGLFSFDGGPLNRIFKTQAFSTFAHIDVFPSQLDFLYGRSLPSFITTRVFNAPQIRSAKLVMEVFNPQGVIDGTAGVMNGFYIAEAYANFSYFGVGFSNIIVAIEMAIVHAVFMRSQKTAVSVAGYAYVTNLFVNTTQGGFIDFIYNPVLWIIILIIMLLQRFYTNDRWEKGYE